MNYQELLQQAKGQMGPYCRVCPVCNGKACGSTMPGPGSKGTGEIAARNYEAWQKLRINMDTIAENRVPDTSFSFFGHTLKAPVMAGPVGAVKLHYGDKMDDVEYNDMLVAGAAEAGILAFTGDGTDPEVMKAASRAIASRGGMGVPTVKPWDPKTLKEKMELVRQSGSFAVAMDIDAAGLPFLQKLDPPAGSKTTEELAAVIREAGKPFIVKGVMTVRGAEKARDAGASAIIVSNHGGRVLDQCPATAEVLPAIARAVGDDMMILVDGGIRTGVDVFKALALGADAVLIARPYVTAVYGGGQEGVRVYTEKLREELADTMRMCGVSTLSEIGPDQIWQGDRLK